MEAENRETKSKTGKKSKKAVIWIIIIAVVLIAVGILIVSNKLTPQVVAVDTEKVTRMDLRETVEVRGVVSGTDTAQVYSKSSNRIAEVMVKEGDNVKAGDKLARLEGDSSGVAYERAALDLESAKRDYENNAELYSAGAISEEEYRKYEKAYKDAELSLSAINTEDDAYVTSPIDGTVTRVNTSVGKLAGGTQDSYLFLVENIDQLQMKLMVSEYQINKVKVGQTVEITSTVLGNEVVTGKVISIAPTGEQKKEGSGEMVIPVTVYIDKDHGGLFAGVNAKATIITGEVKNELAVPVDSVVDDDENGTKYVWVANNGILEKCQVSVLLEGDFYDAVKDDGTLSEGDEVVLSPDYSLTEGMQVQTNFNAE